MHKSDAEKWNPLLINMTGYTDDRCGYLKPGLPLNNYRRTECDYCVIQYLPAPEIHAVCRDMRLSDLSGFYVLLPDRYIALSRQTLLWLLRRVEDTADVRRELLRRLLSGKTLTGRDEDDILRLWWESSNEVEELATRQREQDAIRKFVGGDKSE